MKKSFTLAFLGITAFAAFSYAQGTVSFSNYNSESPPTINYSSDLGVVPAGKAGLALGGSFAAELAWFNGVTSDPSQLTAIPESLTYFGFNGPDLNNTSDGDTFNNGAGWFIGPILSLPGAPQGTIVTFEIFAFNGGSLGSASIAGNSGLFQRTLGGGSFAPASLVNAPNFTVENVPEPSMFALMSLGIAGLIAARRKKV